MFHILFEAVQSAGIAIETGRAIQAYECSGPQQRLIFASDERSRYFDLVVDALGTRATLAPPTGHLLAYGALWASLNWPAENLFQMNVLEQRYWRASKMAGVLPIGMPNQGGKNQVAFFWSLRADQYEAWKAAGLDAWKANVFALWPACAPLLDQIGDPEQLSFARYAHRTLEFPAEPELIHIGDAWHSASPQLGQGANMALLDGWALAKGLRDAGTVEAASELTIAMRRRHVQLYQVLSALFTPIYQSDSCFLPIVRDFLVCPLLALWPATAIQATMVSGLVGNPLKSLGLQ